MVRFQGGEPPILIVHCERGLEIGEHGYDWFIPVSIGMNLEIGRVAIDGTIGPDGERQILYWAPGKNFDDSGTYVSYVSTLARFYPRKAIEAVAARLRPIAWPPKPAE